MNKVCPVVVRRPGTVLAFRHPLAGLQFVKGTVEPGECPQEAASRELREEAGLSLPATRFLGTADSIAAGQSWQFWLMAPADLPETWDHFCEDDGGHTFRFFWQDLAPPLPETFAQPFQHAATFMREALA